MARAEGVPEKSTWQVRVALSIILVALGVIFVVSNRDPVQVAFFGLYFTLPMWLWIALLLVVGIVLGWLRPWRRPKKK